MITNILLGLILGIVLSSYIIINKKVTQIQSNTEYILTKLRGIDGVNSNNNKLIQHLFDRFDKRILVDNEHFEIIKDLIEKNKVEIYNNQQILYNIPVKLETFIAEENDTIRNEIKKLAKISSRKKQASKQSKSINKQ